MISTAILVISSPLARSPAKPRDADWPKPSTCSPDTTLAADAGDFARRSVLVGAVSGRRACRGIAEACRPQCVCGYLWRS
jgi:hypothetical protein